MPNLTIPPPTEAEAVALALAEEDAKKLLSKATGRLGKLLGMNVVSAFNPSKPSVALVLLHGEQKRAIKIISETRTGALLNAVGFLDGISDGVERRLSSRFAVKQPSEIKSLPKQEPLVAPMVRKIGKR